MSMLLDIKFDDPQEMDIFGKALPDMQIIDWRKDKHNQPDLSSVRYALVWLPDEGLLASLPNLEVIFSAGAGVDHIFADPKFPKDIPIVRFVDPDLRDRMSEWIVLQCLMHLRQQRSYDQNQRSRNWVELSQPIASQIRVGIMGLGELGLDAALKLKTMGFQVHGWSRSEKSIKGVRSYWGANALDAFLGVSDILVNLLPLTVETTGILCAELFEKLPQDGVMPPVVINAGRGGSQVEADIVKALKNGTLGGVSLDVFQSEPLSKDSPLWDIDNAIITPHIAAVSSRPALAAYTIGMIKSHENGDGLDNLVDQALGY
jgi:glyoxylate/hydroxypyruvate reductase A